MKMSEQLRDIQIKAGGMMPEKAIVPTSFQNDLKALKAAREEVVICDRSHWGLLKITGEDRLRFLHNQTTNDFNQKKPGENCDTIVVTSTARTIDLITAYITKEAVFLIVSPGMSEYLSKWMDRYIFPMDRVEISDLSAENLLFSLVGPLSETLLQKIGVKEIPAQGNLTSKIGDVTVLIAEGNGLALAGYNLIVPIAEAGAIWTKLVEAGGVSMGDVCWETLRICQGRPAAGIELTEDYNPLEAGLWHCISFSKGCYIGQETIARLNTYKGVKQRLWGVKLDGPVEPKTVVTVDDVKVGILTSYTQTSTGFFGLAYIRTKAGGVGLKVKIGQTGGEIVNLAFVEHPVLD